VPSLSPGAAAKAGTVALSSTRYGLLAALCYGSSDFTAGLGGRHSDPAAITVIAQPFGLVAVAVTVIALSARPPTVGILWCSALSGIGSGIRTVALYRGLAVARMSVAAPLSAISAELPHASRPLR
jgi:uncharacterized membrane protein